LLGAVVGSYQIVRKLGEGGMGAVYLGQHTLLGRRAAIKLLLPSLSARLDIVNRFFNEARAVTSISDPGIVQVFDFGYHTDGSAFIVMEYLEGEALDRRLARLGRLPVPDALRLGRQIASSLAAAHAQHITHRDLKPENIFLVADGEVASGERSKILDFGIAKLSDEHPGKLKTNTGALMGTPIYMSPEQCRGLAELDHRSDIYSLGCVVFHLITGRPPFEGEGMGDIIAAHIREPAPLPSSCSPEVSPGVDAMLARCLAKSPADRFQTMTELAMAIGQLLPLSYPPPHPGVSSPYLAQAATSWPGTAPPGTAPPGTRPPGAAPPGARPPGTAPPGTHPPVPTTLGSSAGQAMNSLATPVPPARARKRAGWLVGLAVVAAAGIGLAVVATRAPGDHAASAPTAPASTAPAPTAPASTAATSPTPTPTAPAPVARTVEPAAAIDAGVPPFDAALAIDATVLDPAPRVAAPPTRPAPSSAPSSRPHRAHAAAPRAGTTATPPGCDRSIDTDCDGIPDVR
jgi:serine/threonine-protein kinase